jgi:transglutaminase-like putative cysteine protease
MAPELSRLVRRVTFILLALTSVAVDVAADDGRQVMKSVSVASVWVAAAVAVARLMPAPPDPRRKPPVGVFLLIGVLALTPFAVEPLRRDWTGDGYPLEIQMVCSLRNVGLGLAACGVWLSCLRLATVTSLFLILFAAAMTDHPAVMVILGLYTATGSVWLMLVYWDGLRSVFVSPDRAVAVEVVAGRERLPWLGLSVLVLLLGLSLALVVVGPKRAAFALGELLPTSGGTGETDPFARYGIGDGPEETAGDNARAAGMVETDKMIEDNKNALIDAVNDTYGPPHRPPKDQERMVAAGRADVIQFHGKLPENRRPSRDFDTSRKGRSPGERRPESQKARGVFEVQGRTPLHVRLVAYSSYDPTEHMWREARKPSSRLIDAEGKDWMRLANLKEVSWYTADERHRLKTADLKSNLVPTPTMLTRFRINKVDKPDYYDWDYDGVLVLAGRTRTPPGVVVTTDCRTLDPNRLPESAFATFGVAGGVSQTLGEVAAEVRPEIERLARDWAGQEPRGWSQVQAVVNKLRSEYVLDRDIAAPPDHPAPVLWFLTESRRGPDYLFATAAALLLRALQYPTRVCLGYYAAPEAYDPETAHTPVKSTDLHFWPEVLLRDGHWLVLEPTPGYEVLGPTLPLEERLLNALTALASWSRRHAVELVIVLAVLTVGWVSRRELIDAVAVRLWDWFPGRSWRDRVLGAVALLERRGRWTGQARLPRQTPRSWLQDALKPRSCTDSDLDRLALMADWAAYAPDSSPPWTDTEVTAVCRRVLDGWTLRRWREKKVSAATGVRP